MNIKNNGTEPVQTSVLDYTLNGTPHYVAKKQTPKFKKGFLFGIVALTAVITVMASWVIAHGGIDNVTELIHGETCDCHKNYELRKATEAVTDGFEEMGLKVGNVKKVYSTDKNGEMYFILKGEIYSAVDKDSEYYDPAMEDYVEGYFIAEALYEGSAEWSSDYGIYKADEKSVFMSDLKSIKADAEEREEEKNESSKFCFDELSDDEAESEIFEIIESNDGWFC